MSNFGIAGIAGAGVVVVVVNNISKGKDPIPAMFAGGLMVVATTAIGANNAKFGKSLAVVFLLGALLSNGGSPLVTLVTALNGITSPQKKSKASTGGAVANAPYAPAQATAAPAPAPRYDAQLGFAVPGGPVQPA